MKCWDLVLLNKMAKWTSTVGDASTLATGLIEQDDGKQFTVTVGNSGNFTC